MKKSSTVFLFSVAETVSSPPIFIFSFPSTEPGMLEGHVTAQNKEGVSQLPLQLEVALWLNSGLWDVTDCISTTKYN